MGRNYFETMDYSMMDIILNDIFYHEKKGILSLYSFQ